MKKLIPPIVSAIRLLSLIAVGVVVTGSSAIAAPLATYQFGAGLTTFGLTLPQAAATTGVQLGALVTQTDVKTRWPDGSIRFAVVSARIPSAGTYELTNAPASAGTFGAVLPTITLELAINGVVYTATPGAFTPSNLWLDGPVVREARVIATPMNGGSAQPLLEVVFDIRSYAGGGHRIDLTVQNVKDSATMDKVAVSSVALKVNGTSIWTHGAVTSYGMTRWRHIEWVGASEAAITPDFRPMFAAAAVPYVLPTVVNKVYDLSGANYDVMGGRPPGGFPAIAYGEMNPDMAAGGGRAEIGAVDWWEASYLVHKTANQRLTVLRNADLTGAWSNHLLKPDGTIIKLGDPGYAGNGWWWDTRASAGNRPLAPLVPDPVAGNNRFRGSREGLSSDSDTGLAGVASRYNEEHVPAPMYVAYLISGDRYYLDQAKFWANCAILKSAPGWWDTDPVNFPGWKRGRSGPTGNERILDFSGMTREFGWPLRLVAYTAWMIPDVDPDKSYFLSTVQNNLNHVARYLDTYVRLGYGGGLGLIGGADSGSGWSTSRNGIETGRYTSTWRITYTAYAVDWAIRQGLWSINPSANAFVNRVANTAVQMTLQNPGFLTGQAGLSYNYYPCYITIVNGRFAITGFDTFAQLKQNNETYLYANDPTSRCPGWNPQSPSTGYDNTDHHLALQMAIRRGLPQAQNAADMLAQVPGHLADLNFRAGFAVTFVPPGGTVPTLPAAPSNLKIIR